MPILSVTVRNKKASYRAEDGALVCGNRDYQIKFDFDSEWDAHPVKTVSGKKQEYGITTEETETTEE